MIGYDSYLTILGVMAVGMSSGRKAEVELDHEVHERSGEFRFPK